MVSSVTDLNQASEDEFNKVPDDFPMPVHMGSIGGAQPKLSAVLYDGIFYAVGTTPPEVYERWILCNDLAEQLTEKSAQSKSGKRAHMSETEILEQYFSRLIATKWTSVPEARWIIQKVAATLNWKISF